MNDGDGSQSADVASRETDRRRLLTLLGVGSIAAVAGSLASPKEAHAGHDGSNTFHLGEENVAPGDPMRTTALRGAGTTSVLDVSNEGNASAINASTQAPMGAAITAFGQEWGVVGHGNDAGVQGFSFSGTGRGIAGHSDGAGTGVSGVTDTGIGVSGGSGSGTGTGVSGMTETGTGVHGHASSSGTGVLGESATGTGGHFESNGTGVQGISGSGAGVVGTSQTGVGGLFSSSGLALRTDGKSAFSTAGSAVVPAGSDSVVVANADVTADSHISVTLTSDPGPRTLGWIDRQPGAGFTVHLSSGKPGPSNPSARPATSLTYLVIEPAS